METPSEGECYGNIFTSVWNQFASFVNSQSTRVEMNSVNSQSMCVTRVLMYSRTVQFLNQICWICDSQWETHIFTSLQDDHHLLVHLITPHEHHAAHNRKLTNCGRRCEGDCFLKSNTNQSYFIMSEHLTSVCFSWISENKDALIV